MYSGYSVYTHVCVLATGAAAPLPETTVKPQHSLLAPGDYVQVQLEVDAFKALQGGDGGWNESMADVSVLLEQLVMFSNK